MIKLGIVTVATVLVSQICHGAGLGFKHRSDKTAAAPTSAALSVQVAVPSRSKKPYTTRRWSYSGTTGPRNWANLHRNFSDCSGANQSPVNLTSFTESVLKPIDFNYQPESAALLNNGHTVQITYRQPKFIKIEGYTFDLQQFHFHAPSEHQIDGESFAMEAHFMHTNDRGEQAIVAVMFAQGEENAALARSISKLPSEAGHKISLISPISPDELLPNNREYYRLNGSLTIPPCTEGVRWYVLKNPATASREQINTIRDALGEPNNRPLQARNARAFLK